MSDPSRYSQWSAEHNKSDDDDDDEGNKMSVSIVAHLAFYSLAFPVYGGSHVDFLHVLQVGVKNKWETSIHTVRAICTGEAGNTEFVLKIVCIFMPCQQPIIHSSSSATIHSYWDLKEC